MVAVEEEGEKADAERDRHEADEPVADVAFGEGMNGRDEPGAGEQRA